MRTGDVGEDRSGCETQGEKSQNVVYSEARVTETNVPPEVTSVKTDPTSEVNESIMLPTAHTIHNQLSHPLLVFRKTWKVESDSRNAPCRFSSGLGVGTGSGAAETASTANARTKSVE